MATTPNLVLRPRHLGRCMRLGGRLPHHHEAGQFQVAYQSLGGDPRHEFIACVGTLPTIKAKREGDGIFYIVHGGGCEGEYVGHIRMLSDTIEQIKNMLYAGARTKFSEP